VADQKLSTMGPRSKPNSSALKSKSTIPIQFPHDGPIFHYKQGDEEVSISIAIQILNDKSSTDTLTSNLCQSLQGAATAKEQLQALQSNRCSLLNLKKKNQISLSLPDETSSRGLYRLLLEWSLSSETTVPLQRAIQSNLKAIDTGSDEIFKQVLASLWKQPQCWRNTLYSLEVAVNFPPLAKILQTSLFDECLSFLFQAKVLQYLSDENSPSLVGDGLVISDILKILLSNAASNRNVPFLPEYLQFMMLLFASPSMPIEGFNTLGIVYGRLYFSEELSMLAKTAITKVDTLDTVHETMSPLARLSMVQGIAATLDLETLTTTFNDTSPLEICWKYSLRVSQVATDPMVRWSALKGLSTLASRWKQHDKSNPNNSTNNHDELVQETLQVVLQAWENPPLRKVGTAIPGLFRTLVKLLPEQQLQELCRRVLEQPVNRKGRYLALEILLPHFPPGETIKAESLLEGVGDRGSNTGPIADLWIKVLAHAWQETETSSDPNAFETWTAHWIPSLSEAFTVGDLSRRKQVASFCLPRIVDLMKASDSLRPQLPNGFIAMLEETRRLKEGRRHSMSLDSMESLSDRALWAQLEISRHANVYKFKSPELKQAIAACLPDKTMRMALTHALPTIRWVAFQSLESVVASYSHTTIEGEASLWRYAFPYSVKTTESKEYTASILQCLSTFLDRFSVWEVAVVEENRKNQPNSESRTGNSIVLPNLHTFIVEFLIKDVFMKKGAYPGTVADKEGFSLALLECILTFAIQDQSYSGDNCVLKSGVIFKRRRKSEENGTMMAVLRALLHREVIAALFALLHSIWDNTRSVAFRFLSKLVIAGQSKMLLLPSEYHATIERTALQARGVYLASSPRQREADTGARILAFLYMSLDSESDRDQYLSSLVDLLQSRLSSMRDKLNAVLEGSARIENSEDGGDGQDLPLAHGIIHAVRLAIDHHRILKRHRGTSSNYVNSTLYEKMIKIFSEAIQLSLSVVADVRDGEMIEGMDSEIPLGSDATKSKGSNNQRSIPLNVNTGAIGANGILSKLSSSDEQQAKNKLAMQRIVVS
jgi:hypothetical protein